MKNLLSTLAFTLCALLAFTSCTDEDNYYVENNIDLIIQQLQSQTFAKVTVYDGEEKVVEGDGSVIAGFEKPFIIIDTNNGDYSVATSYRYYNLEHLILYRITTFNSSPNQKQLTLKFMSGV